MLLRGTASLGPFLAESHELVQVRRSLDMMNPAMTGAANREHVVFVISAAEHYRNEVMVL